MVRILGLTRKIILLTLLATVLPILIIIAKIPSVARHTAGHLSSVGLSAATIGLFSGHLSTELQSMVYWYSLYAIFLSFLLGLFFAGHITRPLRKLSDAAGRIARGDRSVEIEELDVRDELGALTNNFRKMANELDDSYRRIEETKGFLDNIIECSGDAIITTDFDNMITTWNKGAEKLYGFRAGEMIGTSILDIYPEDFKEKRLEWLDDLMRGEVIRNQRTTIYTRKGPVNISLTLSTLKDHRGNPIGTVGVSKDITNEVIAEEKVKVAYERLKELDGLKDDFLRTVSHELRTPLTVIQGAMDITLDVKSANLTKEQRELVELASEETYQLNNLIGNILDLSKEREQLRPSLQKHSIGDIVSEVLDAIKPRAELKKLQVTVDIKEDLPSVMVDRDQIKNAIFHLAENSVKFNREEGKISVKVSHKDRQVRISIIDTGIGIPKSELNKVFDKFYRIEGGTSRKYSGTGLGLAMVRRIIEAHGGKIRIKSTVGEGTEFTVTLPAEEK